MIKSKIYNKNCIAPCFDNSLLHAPLFSQKQMKNIKRFFVGAFAVLILLAFITPVIAYAGIADETKNVTLYGVPYYYGINAIDESFYVTDEEYSSRDKRPKTGKIEWSRYEGGYKEKEKYTINITMLRMKNELTKEQQEKNKKHHYPECIIKIHSFQKSYLDIFGNWTGWADCYEDFGLTSGVWYDFEDIYKVLPEQYGRMYANPTYTIEYVFTAITFVDDLLVIQTEDEVGAKQGFFVHGTYWIVIRNIYNVLLQIGILLLVVYFVLHMIQTASETGGFTPEKWLSLGIKFVLAVMLMTWGFTIISYIIKLGNGILSELQYADYGDQNPRFAQLENALKNVLRNPTGISMIDGMWGWFNGIIDGISAAFQTAWTLLGLLLVQLIGTVCLLSRTLKLAIYISFTPIALADSWNGVNSHSIKFLKQIFSTILQGTVISAAILLFKALSQNGTFESTGTLSDLAAGFGDGTIGPIKTLLLGIGACSIILSSKKISDSIIGA